MANDLPGYGTKLQITISSTLTDIPQTFEISWDGFSVAERNPTALASGHVRKKPGLPNYGEVKFKVWYDPNDATHILIRDRVKTPSQTLDTFKLIYNDGDTTPANAIFTGFIKDFNQSGVEPESGTLEFEATIAVDGVTSFTAGVP